MVGVGKDVHPCNNMHSLKFPIIGAYELGLNPSKLGFGPFEFYASICVQSI